MRGGRYNKLPRTHFDELRGLSLGEKTIATYSRTAQANRVGIFRFSLAGGAEDLEISLSLFGKGFQRVVQHLGLGWDEMARVLYWPDWWKTNCPDNANALKGFLTDLGELPKTTLLAEFANNLTYLPEELHETFRLGLPERSVIPSQIQSPEQSGEGVGDKRTKQKLDNDKTETRKRTRPSRSESDDYSIWLQQTLKPVFPQEGRCQEKQALKFLRATKPDTDQLSKYVAEAIAWAPSWINSGRYPGFHTFLSEDRYRKIPCGPPSLNGSTGNGTTVDRAIQRAQRAEDERNGKASGGETGGDDCGGISELERA